MIELSRSCRCIFIWSRPVDALQTFLLCFCRYLVQSRLAQYLLLLLLLWLSCLWRLLLLLLLLLSPYFAEKQVDCRCFTWAPCHHNELLLLVIFCSCFFCSCFGIIITIRNTLISCILTAKLLNAWFFFRRVMLLLLFVGSFNLLVLLLVVAATSAFWRFALGPQYTLKSIFTDFYAFAREFLTAAWS